LAELLSEISYPLQTELVKRIHNPPFPVAAAALFARPHNCQPRSAPTPGVYPDNHAIEYSNQLQRFIILHITSHSQLMYGFHHKNFNLVLATATQAFITTTISSENTDSQW